ncbi:MAG TPA: HEAT repeat domain-containing protein [Candidatus Binatia bacterium]
MDEEPAQLDALIKSLDQPDKKALRRSVDTLIGLARTAPELAGRLSALMDGAPAEKRWPMAYVLAHISPLSPQCLDALEDTLGVDDPDIRWAVAVLLVRLAQAPGSIVVARLIALLQAGKPTQRRMAVYCLRDIGAGVPSLEPALHAALDDPEPLVRVAAATSLKTFPEIGKNALDRLLRMISMDPDSRVRASAALALAHLDAPAEQVRLALQAAGEDSDPRLVKAARAALALLEQKGPAPSAKENTGPGD